MFKLIDLIKNTSVVGGSTIISRIAGYVREIFLAAWMGTSAATDALIVATRIPTLLRKISTEGSLNGALIPLLEDLDTKHDKEVIHTLINKIILIFLTFFIGFYFFETLGAKWMLKALAPGVLKSPDRLYWFLQFIPFTSLSVIFFFLSGIFSAILNFNKQFFVGAIAPAFWNLTLISLIFVAQILNLSYFTIGPIFLFATFIQALITYIPYRKLKVKLKTKKTKDDKIILRQFFKNFFPIMFSASISQINSIILIALTSFLPSGSTTILHRTERLLQVPVGMILALNTSLLPTLTQNQKYRKKISRSAIIMCAMVFVPISLIFFFFHTPIVSLIFNYGKCTQSDVHSIASLLKLYSFGVPAFLLVRILPIFFFATKEVRIPAIGATMHTITNVSFSFLFMKFELVGFAYAAILSAWIHTIFLLSMLFKKKYL